MERWPQLDYPSWSGTCETLHLWTQIIGKLKLRLCAPQSHWWHVALFVTPRGLRSGPIPYESMAFEAEFDLLHHQLKIETTEAKHESFALRPMSVRDFYRELTKKLANLGIQITIDMMPKEVPHPIRFDEDTTHCEYDQDAIERFRQVLLNCAHVLTTYQAKFCGKSSPVQFYWGSFDLTVVRFSGVMKDAVSAEGVRQQIEEEIAVGFWPGSESYPKPAFYAYALPPPPGYYDQKLSPPAARFETTLGEFAMDYDDIRSSAHPEREIMEFFQSAYETAANLGKWDRKRLEKIVLEKIP